MPAWCALASPARRLSCSWLATDGAGMATDAKADLLELGIIPVNMCSGPFVWPPLSGPWNAPARPLSCSWLATDARAYLLELAITPSICAVAPLSGPWHSRWRRVALAASPLESSSCVPLGILVWGMRPSVKPSHEVSPMRSSLAGGIPLGRERAGEWEVVAGAGVMAGFWRWLPEGWDRCKSWICREMRWRLWPELKIGCGMGDFGGFWGARGKQK
jgi:hypothetical protein